MGTIEVVNLAEQFARIPAPWQPRIAGEVGEAYVKLGKFLGEFVWHSHADEDELFLVVRGRIRMCLRDGDRWVEQGEFIVIPRGVEHKPVAEEEADVLLFEPKSTLNTGDVENELTLRELQRI
jgi:mannose-6-phosphate isomerase-like protein (cupin superfamily)